MYHTIDHIDTHARARHARHSFSTEIHAQRRTRYAVPHSFERTHTEDVNARAHTRRKTFDLFRSRTERVLSPYGSSVRCPSLPNPIPRAGYKVKRPLYYRHLIVINAPASRTVPHTHSRRGCSRAQNVRKTIRISLIGRVLYAPIRWPNTKAKSPPLPPLPPPPRPSTTTPAAPFRRRTPHSVRACTKNSHACGYRIPDGRPTCAQVSLSLCVRACVRACVSA